MWTTDIEHGSQQCEGSLLPLRLGQLELIVMYEIDFIIMKASVRLLQAFDDE